MKHILMLLSNAYRPDPRVEREADTLAQAGYRVSVVCWDREVELPAHEQSRQVEIHRIHSVPTRYGAGPRQLFKTPRFWQAAFDMALELKPDAVHCHDLDTLYAGIRIKRRLGCPLVFDAHEDYPALMTLYLPRFMVSLLRLFEQRLVYRADAILTASTVYAQKLAAEGLAGAIPIPNVDDLDPYDTVHPEMVQARRRSLGLQDGVLTVAYIGGFTRNRQLLPLIEAARLLPQVQFLLWGDGHQRQAVVDALQGMPNVQYLGWLPADQVPATIKALDIIYYCLREDYPGTQFNAPNTLSHAMSAGRPLIANPVGDLGWTVRTAECGILIDPVNPENIRLAVLDLSAPEMRQRMGAAGYAYAREKYNWKAVSARLLAVYAGLFDSNPPEVVE
jgi:glycosyltransferase involved in cell wall biosynthesis